ncbi:MAG: metallophosphoesterase [archaeon]
MKINYATDLHGDTAKYDVLFNSGDVIVIGGDMLPNHVTSTDAGFSTLSTEDYFRIMEENQRFFLKDYLIPKLESIKNSKKKVYLMMGNDDFACNLDLLEEADRKGLVKLLYDKKKENTKISNLDKDLLIAGYPYVPITPFAIKDWEKYDNKVDSKKESNFNGYKSIRKNNLNELLAVDLENIDRAENNLQKDFEKIAKELGSKIKKTIFVIHSPPYSTVLDIAGRYEGWHHVGSLSISKFIEQQQPLASLHGHIHESPIISGQYSQKIGKTFCFNPGSDKYNLNLLILDTSDIESAKVRKIKLERNENFSGP